MVSENEFLLHSLLMGVFITFLYDVLRVLRRVVPHGSFLVSLEDFIFWVYCGAEVFLLMYHESNGTIRWFSIIGALAGIIAYKKLVSTLFVKYVSLALAWMLGRLLWILRWLLKPLGFLGRKTNEAWKRAGGGVGRRFRKVKRALKNKLTLSLKMFKMSFKK